MLYAPAGLGASAAGGIANAAMGTAGQVGNAAMGGGTALGQGIMGGGNAIAGGTNALLGNIGSSVTMPYYAQNFARNPLSEQSPSYAGLPDLLKWGFGQSGGPLNFNVA